VSNAIRRALAESRARATLGRLTERAAVAVTGHHYLALEYPPAASDTPRWGHGRPPHPQLTALISAHHDAYERAIATILEQRDALARIPDRGAVAVDSPEPRWNPDNVPGLDGATIYAFVRDRAPKLYLEIGSGNSTKFAARAVRDSRADTEIVSIDPHPRQEVDAVCDHVERAPLEAADLSRFWALAAGDVVFFDGSHRAFMNSDVTVFFLEILPRLAPGVLVGIHDIELPDDYSLVTAPRYWSEQYILAAYLLGGHAGCEIVFPSWYVSQTPALAELLDPLWAVLPPVERHGNSFWLQTLGEIAPRR
jgi:predicted O-methyltransferase YrrM